MDAPDWLIAWREGSREGVTTGGEPAARATQGTTAAQARAQRPAGGRATGGSPQAKGKAAALRAAAAAAPAGVQPSALSQGFAVPHPWPDDGGKRREAVLDLDEHPPRVVRRVGWSPCLSCQTSFFSPDVVSVRLCPRCKGPTDKTAPKPMR